MSPHASLPFAALSPVSIDTLGWRLGADPQVTVAVRADVSLVPGGTATLSPPLPVLRVDHLTMPGPTFRTPRQLWPSLPRPEVTVIGSAFANGAMETTVRFAMVGASGARLIDKSLLVRGRRGRHGEPRAVDGLLLDYCSAVGGAGFAANPLGRGMTTDLGEAPPAIFDPDDHRAVAGFCPVPAGFPARVAHLGAHGRGIVAGDLALPENFDSRYFQAAPPDQQVAALHGDERVVLENMSNAHPVIDTRLPGLIAVGRLYDGEVKRPLALRLESIHVDVDALSASIVWRATIDDPAPARPTIVVQLVSVGQVVQWPRSLDGDERIPRRSADKSRSTMLLTTDGEEGIPRRSADRSRSTMLLAPDGEESIPRRSADKSRSTMLLATDEARARSGTLPLGDAAPPSMPFQRAPRPARETRPPSEPTPGAPWAKQASRPVVPAHNALAGTLDVSSVADLDLGRSAAPSTEEVRRAEEAQRSERARLEEERLTAEAQARRAVEREDAARADAERFAKDQAAVRKTESERRAAEAAERAKSNQALKKKAYGGFDD